jgi:hypothetical protein
MDPVTTAFVITLDGKSPKATRNKVEGDEIVQFGSFYDSFFPYEAYSHKNVTVIIKNMVIYDDHDLDKLVWLFFYKFNVDMTESYIGFIMLKQLADKILQHSLKCSLKLRLPWGGGNRELEMLEYSKPILNKSGVKYV